jgi:hypothetical protein
VPVILHPDCYELCLEPGMQKVTAISELQTASPSAAAKEGLFRPSDTLPTAPEGSVTVPRRFPVICLRSDWKADKLRSVVVQNAAVRLPSDTAQNRNFNASCTKRGGKASWICASLVG